MYDVAAIGELLIDFTPAGRSEAGQVLFEQSPGGAPANVLAAVAKLGKKAAFLGMVGNDQFGAFLRDVLQKNNIETTGLKISSDVHTTLAFVYLDSHGDRSFSFYRNPGADLMITEMDLEYRLIQNAKTFHFGSLSLTDEPARSATLAAVKFAKEQGLLISYDPNFRPTLWKSKETARERIVSMLQYADLLKVSEEEMELITGTGDLEKGSAALYDRGINAVLVTLGPQGCYYRYRGGFGRLPACQVKAVDTTGAGDAFVGGVLYWLSGLSKREIDRLSQEEFERILAFSNAMGALAATRKGAITAMPSLDEVQRCLAANSKAKAQ